MKNTTSNILRTYSVRDAKAIKAKATIKSKRRFYFFAINASMIILCIGSIAGMVGLTIGHFTNKMFFGGFTPFSIATVILMITGLVALPTSLITKKIWEWRLWRLGIIVPIELS